MDTRLTGTVNSVELQRLQQDHAAIRAKLHQLKSSLNGGLAHLAQDEAGIQQGVRALCLELAGELQEHIQLEGWLENRCCVLIGPVGPEESERLALEHDADQKRLGVINRLLAHEGSGWVAHAGPLLVDLIAHLKRRMDAQEDDLFPFMDRVFAVDHCSNGSAHSEASNVIKRNGEWNRLVPHPEDITGLRKTSGVDVPVKNGNGTNDGGRRLPDRLRSPSTLVPASDGD